MQTVLPLVVFVVIAAGVDLASAGGGSWSYDNSHGTGPNNWNKDYPTCAGTKQSPIDIVGRLTDYASFEPFQFQGYDSAVGFYQVTNNGHTVQLSVLNGAMSISGGGLPEGTYRFLQFHVHWGGENNVGSEHTVDGRFYPLEIHLVHFNTKYPDVASALQKADGLAVLGIFAEVGNTPHATLEKFIASFGSVSFAEMSTNITAFALNGLLPSNKQEFTRYEGSLTTPGCAEVVTWTVFKQPITISQTQLNKFRTLHHNKQGVHDEALVNNYRPVQTVGSRRVKRNYEVLTESDAQRQVAPLSLCAMTLVVTVLQLFRQ